MEVTDQALSPIKPFEGAKAAKMLRVRIDETVEFSIYVRDPSLTCGWLLSETTRRYASFVHWINHSNEKKIAKRLITALKTQGQSEGLDFWLT